MSCAPCGEQFSDHNRAMDRDPPDLKVVSSKTDHDLALAGAQKDIERATKQLAANMIRVIRGAGEPLYLFDQVVDLHRAFRECPEGTMIGQINDAMVTALNRGLSEDGWDFDSGIDDIERGALRAVAARLLGQHAQASLGNRDLWEGYYRVERYRERSRAEYLASQRAMPKTRKKRERVVKAILKGQIPPIPNAEQIKDALAKPQREVTVEKQPGESTAAFMKRMRDK